MIVQSADEGAPHLVITMAEHTEFAGRAARAFGNDEFEPVAPRDEMLFVIDHHDQGWAELDAAPGLDPDTRLPYSLTRTPFAEIITTSARSPNFNEAHHPYSGLLSSMHSWGLYNGRYGMSDRVLLDLIAAEHRPEVEIMLDGEIARQERIKASLADDPETAAWIEPEHLFQNYKQLQFFDTLALYFNLTGADEREATSFAHVPMTGSEDATVALRPMGSGTYGLAPYPFAEDELEMSFTGRNMAPVDASAGSDLGREEVAALLREAPAGEERVRFVAS
jgi:hypothetical protein